MSLNSPSGVFLHGIEINNPSLPLITLMSCTTKLSSIVIEATAFNFASSFVTILTLTSVIFKCLYRPLFKYCLCGYKYNSLF